MIRARAGKHVILGLSHEHLRGLKEGQPISFSMLELGVDLQLFIFSEATEDKMRKTMESFIGPDTKVSDRSKNPQA